MNTPLNKNIAVVLTFEQGTFESGFSAIAKLLENGVRVEQRERIRIPPIPELKYRYQEWKQQYLDRATRTIEIPREQIHHVNLDDWREAANNLLVYLRQHWFDREPFQLLKEWIRSRTRVSTDRSVPIFFEFDTHSREQDLLLRRLPWSCWDLFRELPNAEATLGIAYTNPVKSSLRNIRILAVFGSDEGTIELADDRTLVSELKKFGARVHDLSCPEPDKLYSALRHNIYDVLFFAGHSFSQDDQCNGVILLKPKMPVYIDALHPCLQAAVNKGLKLAIFNSCDGLGLAEFLVTKAKIPAVIVFREPVPDEVARTFLKYFIEEFSRGTPLCLSVREARNRLQALETSFPCASWLPVVCQNPSQSELIWRQTLSRNWLWKIGTVLLALASLTAGAMLLNYLIKKQPNYQQISDIQENQISQTEAKSVLVSRGNKLIMISEKNDAKIRGIEAYDARNWKAAIEAFRESLHQELQENKESKVKDALDPETWIYLNNAIAEKKAEGNLGKIVELAIIVPAQAKEGQPWGEQHISKELLHGAALRQAESNCGVEELVAAIEKIDRPLNCQPQDKNRFFHITIANDFGHEDRAEMISIELAKKTILGVVGYFSSSSCLRAKKVYEKNEIVIISPTCTSTKLSGSSDYFFRTIPNDEIAAKSLWAQVGDDQTKVAIAYARNSEYTESFKEAFEQQLPQQKYIYTCSDLSDNFYAPGCAEEAKNKGANFLLLVPTTTGNLNSALSILTHLDDDLVPLGSDSVYNSAIIDPSGYGQEAAEKGLKIYVPWHPSSNPNQRTDFEKNATRLFDFARWNWRSQSSYDALSALTQGIRELEDDLSGNKLMKKLRSPGFAADGVVGEGSVKFLPNGDRDFRGFEDDLGTIVRVEEYQDENGEIRYRFKGVNE